jgi:NAD(P)-dependent dehydrogenase (short-subunit alcohol dehydrogenase family)
VFDVAGRGQVRLFLKETKAHFGHVNGIVNSAGTPGRLAGTHGIWQVPTKEFDLIMDGNRPRTFIFLAEALDFLARRRVLSTLAVRLRSEA